MHQEKVCPNCDKWTSTKSSLCSYCGAELFEKERMTREALDAQPDPFKIPLIKIHSKDGYLIVFGKRIIQSVQLVFFGIISLLIWIASLMPG